MFEIDGLILDDLVDAVKDKLKQSEPFSSKQPETIDGVPVIHGTFGTFHYGEEPPVLK